MIGLFKPKKKCDGCGVKLKEDNFFIVKFGVTEEETGEKKTGEMHVCQKCMDNIEAVIKEEIAEGRATEDESL